ncbi:hypothetical protein [Methylobacterium sp.]|uniref:hypothetical protein n=1 Tax=Methylobacterium sp. TaxID=409 RepID=UPI003D0A2004
MAKTAEIATGFYGSKLYQQRARLILPILVRQAQAHSSIFYEDLAQEVGMTNPRTLNYPLGCIGDALNDLAETWDTEIPHIQALVKNQQLNMPGPGFDGFLTRHGYTWDNLKERSAIVSQYWARIFAYPYWHDVLHNLGLQQTSTGLTKLIEKAGTYGGKSEGPDHKALKEFVRNNPHLVGLQKGDATGETEHLLPSADRIDVIFDYKKRFHAVEVKPATAPVGDILRGLFQCVKYRAVLAARAAYEHDDRKITGCLALGGTLPSQLIPLRNSLQVDVIEGLADQMP